MAANKQSEWSAIDQSKPKAVAWFLKYATADIKAACGIDVKVSIDIDSWADPNENNEPRNVVGELYCGHVQSLFTDLCKDDVGKAAAKTIKAVHCEKVIGKARKTPTTQLFTDLAGDENAFDLVDGKLTLRFKHASNPGMYENALRPRAFPKVDWHRETADSMKEWNRRYAEWSEDKDGVEFTVDVDEAGFAGATFVPSKYICGTESFSHPLETFLDTLYKTTTKGKKILQGVKRVTCSVTTDPNGKTPELAGDRLIFYARLLKESKTQAGGVIGHGMMPSNDAYLAYAKFRKAHNLGGECVWARSIMDKDAEADQWCPEKN